MPAQLTLQDIAFTYDGAPDRLFEGINVAFPPGWTAIVGPNGAGKTTLLLLAAGILTPDFGSASRPGPVAYCQQRTDEPPADFGSFLDAGDSLAVSWRRRLEIGDGWLGRWDTLSHGERKRAQIATSLWLDPAVLAVDEPTNHLDRQARELLLAALRSYRGIGLLVSHDRELLDSLCTQCLILRPPRAAMRPGGYSEAMKLAREEDARLRGEYELKKQQAQRLAAEASRRRVEANGADARRSKRHLALRDSDGRAKIDAAIVSGADGRAGRLARQLQGRVDRAVAEMASFQLERQYSPHYWLPDSHCPRPVVVSIGPGSFPIGDGRRLEHPELTVGRQDRIAVTGANGSGKSTLIRRLLERIALPSDRVIYLPQEIDTRESARIMAEVNSLSPDELGRLMTTVSCLGSRPQRLVGNTDVSPGELRKVLLALGISRSPWLIVMDEPTNHLDLPAIECLEDALAGCPCAMLMASHDARFVDRLKTAEWSIEASTGGGAVISIE